MEKKYRVAVEDSTIYFVDYRLKVKSLKHYSLKNIIENSWLKVMIFN